MTKTISGELRQQALQAVRDASPDGPGGVRMQATKLLRDRTRGARHPLSDLLAAVEWAREEPADLSQYVAAHDPATGRTQYTFPNGHSAAVIPDPHRPLRWEVFSDDPADAGRGHVVAGLTSDAAEAKLLAVQTLPAREIETNET